jgi:hypothetical protein
VIAVGGMVLGDTAEELGSAAAAEVADLTVPDHSAETKIRPIQTDIADGLADAMQTIHSPSIGDNHGGRIHPDLHNRSGVPD